MKNRFPFFVPGFSKNKSKYNFPIEQSEKRKTY